MIFHQSRSLKGEITVPGDKSISHRAVMFASLAEGISEVTNFLQGADCLSTIRCFRQLGITIDNDTTSNSVTIHGKGLFGLKEANERLDVGNSGTTMRLISGILSGQNFPVTITGDESIQRRPMGRIMTPLRMMGANITSLNDNDCAPLLINHNSNKPSNHLIGIHYKSPVASAQIKSCVLLAGLYANGETSVTEPSLSRDHTERMLREFGATVTSNGNTATILPRPSLTGGKIHVPGDISSAAYFIAAGLIVPNSEIVIKNVGINPTRDGILHVCRQMGGKIRLENVQDKGGEPTADIIVKHSELNGIEIGGSIIPTLIDEIPVIAVLACFAKGKTVIRDAAELKVKESNRIDVMVENLAKMGADITATEDGMIIHGGKSLHGASIQSKFDHRIAMSFAVASLMAEGETIIHDAECVDISYPNFYSDLNKLSDL
ncbi:MAG: 3-phosphoshikimate 1-carboxyvinyltransferase [Clostridiales bacterium]|jgi:3-phosphoshikimate 1-carboxyvinyltransferase|nr:3-phosphoshikimate 1-carboxyvinyltransferase [Clostridiales bacterium]